MKTANKNFSLFLFFIVFSALTFKIFCQTIDHDSIFKGIESKSEEDKAAVIIQNIKRYATTGPEKTLDIVDKLLLSEKIKRDTKLKLHLMRVRAECYITLSKFNKASETINSAIAEAVGAGAESELSSLYIQAGRNSALLSRIESALEFYLKGISIAERKGLKSNLAEGYTHLGILYYILKDYKKALELNRKAEGIALELNLPDQLADIYTHESIVLLELKEYKKAMEYSIKAIKLYEESGNLKELAGAYENVALLYRFMNQDLKGLEYSRKALDIQNKINDIKGSAASYTNIGGVYLDLNRFNEAIDYFNRAKILREGIHDVRGLQYLYFKLATTYEKKGDYRKALENYRLHKLYYDSLFSIESANKIRELEQASLTDKNTREIESLKAINEKDSIIRLFLIIAITFFAVSLFVTLMAYRHKQTSNRALEEINKSLVKQRAELERLNEELNSHIRDKQKFFKIIAHDLRSPLFTLMSMIEIIAQEKENLSRDKLSYFSDEAYLLTQKIHSLLENLLSWASYDTGKIEIHPEFFDIQTQAEAILALNESSARKKNLMLSYSGGEGLTVRTDKQVFNLVLRNLISNAIKYSHQGGEVRVTAYKEDSLVSLKVTDSGVGIPKEILKDLFTNKIHSQNGTNNEKGSGLGSMLCKEMSSLIGAELSARNISGGGAEFKLRIPI